MGGKGVAQNQNDTTKALEDIQNDKKYRYKKQELKCNTIKVIMHLG